MKQDPAIEKFRIDGIRHWDGVADRLRQGHTTGSHYHRMLEVIYAFHIPPGCKVLELACGTGELLAAVKPSCGVGIDYSSTMIGVARSRHPDLIFTVADVTDYTSAERFDVVIASDLVNNLFDVQRALQAAHTLCKPDGRIIINFFSHVWEKPLKLAGALGMANLTPSQNWLEPADMKNMLYLTGWEIIRTWADVLCPLNIPLLEPLCNRFLAKLWPTRAFCLTNFFIARPNPQPRPLAGPQAPSVSVVIPARNEAGNIDAVFARIPRMGSKTELVIVEGHSTDNTYETVQNKIKEHPEWTARLLRQTGKGKADAVRLGFGKAEGDVLMILDADLTVVPEDLPRFYEALVTGRGEFINGVRLVYPMEGRAMQFLNLLGNKFFSVAFSWLLGQSVKDTLCGTKVLYRSDYEKIRANRHYFGEFDPFGDYDLIFGAAKLGLKIVDMPIRYRDRTYGETNIHRWAHGWLLLRMVMFAARRIKFV